MSLLEDRYMADEKMLLDKSYEKILQKKDPE